MRTRYSIICFLLFQFIPHLFYAQGDLQTRTIKFAYDADGNRYHRWVEILKISNTDSLGKMGEDSVGNVLIGEISEIQGRGVSMFPNPTQGQIDLRITGMQEGEVAEYIFFSITGVELRRGSTSMTETMIDISSFPPGTYYSRVSIGKKVQGWKLIKY